MTGIELITQERAEQIEKHHRSIEFDKQWNNQGQIVTAVRALLDGRPDLYGYPESWQNSPVTFKMHGKPHKERLIIAGALIAAEIDRLNAIENG